MRAEQGWQLLALKIFGSFDWQEFSKYVESNLPKYARPVFIRIIQEMDTTGTFKLKKNDLRDEAFDLSKVSDKVYCLKPNSSDYVALDNEWLEVINSEQAGY